MGSLSKIATVAVVAIWLLLLLSIYYYIAATAVNVDIVATAADDVTNVTTAVEVTLVAAISSSPFQKHPVFRPHRCYCVQGQEKKEKSATAAFPKK